MQRIAIVGSGIAGLGAAWRLREHAEVTVFEQSARPGGHVNTIETADGGVDTGFIVHNDRNYPLFNRLLEDLNVTAQDSDMSFGVSLDGGRVEWAGDSLSKLFARRALAADPQHWRMLADVVRFNRRAKAYLASGAMPAGSIGDYIGRHRYSRAFAERYLLPMASAIWSTPSLAIRDFPTATLVRFFHNHGLLDLGNRPQWRTIRGGSGRYVQALVERLGPQRLRLETPVVRLKRVADGVELQTRTHEREHFDHVVLACHPPAGLALLADAAADETRVLGAFKFTTNRAVLHTDAALMPLRRRVWSSWNYIGPPEPDDARGAGVTYWMNRLQQLAATRQYFVSLNPAREPAAKHRLYEIDYDHPVFSADVLAAQDSLAHIQGRGGLWHCGAWCYNGFHEDGLSAGTQVAARLGAPERQGRAA